MSSLASSTAEQEQIFRVSQKEPRSCTRDGSRDEARTKRISEGLHFTAIALIQRYVLIWVCSVGIQFLALCVIRQDIKRRLTNLVFLFSDTVIILMQYFFYYYFCSTAKIESKSGAELSANKCLGQSPEDDYMGLSATGQRIVLLSRILMRYCAISIKLSSQLLYK